MIVSMGVEADVRVLEDLHLIGNVERVVAGRHHLEERRKIYDGFSEVKVYERFRGHSLTERCFDHYKYAWALLVELFLDYQHTFGASGSSWMYDRPTATLHRIKVLWACTEARGVKLRQPSRFPTPLHRTLGPGVSIPIILPCVKHIPDPAHRGCMYMGLRQSDAYT